MTLYNVSISIVDLIEADSPEEAIDALHRQILDAGLEPLEQSGDAFESEPL